MATRAAEAAAAEEEEAKGWHSAEDMAGELEVVEGWAKVEARAVVSAALAECKAASAGSPVGAVEDQVAVAAGRQACRR